MPKPLTGGVLPLLPLRDIVVFPQMATQLFVGREKSIAALDEAAAQGGHIVLAAQTNARTNDPTAEEIYNVGTAALLLQKQRLPDGTVKVLIEGQERVRLGRYVQSEPYFAAEYTVFPHAPSGGLEVEALMRSALAAFETYAKLSKKVSSELMMSAQTIDEPARLSDVLAGHLVTLKLADRQGLLELLEPKARLEKLIGLLQGEIEILNVERKIRSRVKKQMERTQKEYYLNEQMQAIQKELGGGERDEIKSEIQELEEAILAKKMSEEATAKAKKELKKLKMMHPTSAEATVVRNYIDWILDLPWATKSEELFDLTRAEEVLNEDHFGLKKIKERIIEHLAVQALTKKLRGPILCFVGPPGVGKTSLAKSIARATGRKFIRLSLGGVRDEAEIRGHRRTYIGAMPGKLIQSLKKVGTSNPVMLLDEIDKMSSDFRGDPAAALLEVLDAEQNTAFGDHYLDLDYDLSDVMFITTANSLSGIPIPLQDRMEIIELSGYTELEKIAIAEKYLVPRQRVECGLEGVAFEFPEAAIRTIIHHYTREAGVRNLEREIGSILRKIARQVVGEGKDARIEVTARSVAKLLGVAKHRIGRTEETDSVGLVNGLAVTSVGGDLLPVEATVVPGKGKLVVTGLVEKGMEESGHAAMTYVRSRLERLGLSIDLFSTVDVHVHFPEFVRKDGPSAGVTMVTAVVSALMKAPVRHDVAMTGEITLRGRVLPIGGVKDKLLAAQRGGVRTVIMPAENRKDLAEVPASVLEALRVVLVEHIDDVLKHALVIDSPAALFDSPYPVYEMVGGTWLTPPQEGPVAGSAQLQ